MAKLDHTYDAIADTYASTLMDLSEAAGNSDEVQAQFLDFVAYMDKDPEFGEFMTTRAVDEDSRRPALEKMFRGRMIDLLLDTLQVINNKGRCELIPLICERYRLALEKIHHEVDVHVISAVGLTDELRQKIQESATKVAGRTARLMEKVDPEILGGLVIRIGDEKMDASVSNQLDKLRVALHERALHEIHDGKDYFEAAEAL